MIYSFDSCTMDEKLPNLFFVIILELENLILKITKNLIATNSL